MTSGHRRSDARCRGFTIVELLVAMAILGILAAAIMPLGETLLIAQKERELRAALVEIRAGLDEFKKAADQGTLGTSATASGYPTSLAALAAGVPDARPHAQGRNVYFLRRIPRDPFADARLPSDKTWRLRSYASPPEKPEPGEDVFDVFSGSPAQALDGSRYSQW